MFSLEDIDDFELIELIIAECLSIVESKSSHLAHSISKMSADQVAAIKAHLFLPWIGSKVLSLNREAIAVMDDQSIGYKLMSRKHFQTVELLRLSQVHFIDAIDLINGEFLLSRMHTT